jgi:hypothetical protein
MSRPASGRMDLCRHAQLAMDLLGSVHLPRMYLRIHPYLARNVCTGSPQEEGRAIAKGTQFERLPSSIRDGASFSCTNTQDCKWYPLLPKDWSLTVLPFQSLCRPIIMMFKETIIFCMSIYLSFIYSLLYLLFFAFPIAFEEVRGWNPGTTGTAFVAVMVSCPCPNSCV